MTHTPNSTTHWACTEQIDKLKGDVVCCECTKHKCYGKREVENSECEIVIRPLKLPLNTAKR